MMVNTTAGIPVTSELVGNYFESLVNHFFKILPMRENEEPTLSVYTYSLLTEMLGCQKLIDGLNTDARFLTLLSILQYISDNPDTEVSNVKREVFRAIRICNRLEAAFEGRVKK